MLEILDRLAKATKALDAKMATAVDELDLTEQEKMILEGAKRKQKASSPEGPKGPRDALKALLGGVVPILGKFAMDVALQWLNAEIKYTVYTTAGNVTTTAGYALLAAVAQGVDYNQRVGNSIRILGLDWRINAQYNSASSAITHNYRCVFGVDTQTDGALPTDSVMAEGGSMTPFVPIPYIKDSPDRFAILHDEVMELSPTVKTSMWSIKKLEDLVSQNLHTLYDGTGSTVASISRGSLFICHVSDQATNAPLINITVRVFYEDT